MKVAVVLGGSIAGLLAARVLTGYADEVRIVEPDVLEDGPQIRRGAPHSSQAHSLLGLGRATIEQLLPGIVRSMVHEGGQLLRGSHGAQWFLDGVPKTPIGGGSIVSVSRPFLEWQIRRRVLALPGIQLCQGTGTGLTLTGNRVDGVLVRPPRAVESVHVAADLVVDATGRASRLAEWLGRHGYPAPPRQRVGLDLGYATCLFHRSPGQRIDGYVAAHSAYAPRRAHRGPSSMTPVEGDRWLVLVSGYGADRPGRDFDAFVQRCRSDAAAPMRALPDACEPVSDVYVHRFPDSVRRDFDRLSRFPAGLVVVGDAVASLNPTYGQGISSAAAHATALDEWLRGAPELDEAAHPYFRRVRSVLDDAWQTSVVQDRLLPHVQTAKPLGWRLRGRVHEAVLAATVTDPVVHRTFLEVVNMTASPDRLRRPGILWRAGVAAYRRRRGTGTGAA